ncbi:uncharacterized protein LOC113512528 [Galleria mellonella]|uniref:Uncharacterized protein LOC113512528 n=1 Tax=Galleria mellonella TaxID=7137 RepID=A0A6J1WMA1_GALME|nr:uncharacterized protein LOC113512528 [Galleria mellonella]
MILLQRKSSTLLLIIACIMHSSSPNDDLENMGAISPKHFANISYEIEKMNPSGVASIFSPRMNFDQWKPLTGRGDPLRKDPTYDYEPPLLERVHYWADETRFERDHYPEKKSEVLMLGVSSRRPSIAPRQPSMPRRHHRPPPPPPPPKYEDFTYKLSDRLPMTILVPPPPPPNGHQTSLFILPEVKIPAPTTPIKLTEPPTLVTKDNTGNPGYITSSYALQEANLIYQSSTINDNWIINVNETQSIPNAVSSDYAGWGPTTPTINIDVVNDTHNLISNDVLNLSKSPYSFYKPMLSEAPPPPQITISPLLLPTFVPTVPPSTIETTTFSALKHPNDKTTIETITENQDYYENTTTERQTTLAFQPTPNPTLSVRKPEKSFLDMLGPMMSMPLVNGPDRPEDNLYAHASENLQVYKDQTTQDIAQIETMQTMQPPPPIKFTESSTILQPYHQDHMSSSHRTPALYSHDPYLHMRFTTPMSTVIPDDTSETKSTTVTPPIPMYLIIQGHSKVKTYSSKPTFKYDNDTMSNEIPKQNETNEVKHLHPIKEMKKPEKITNRTSRSQNLKSLVDKGYGSIEIQETDIGIKYDISDGSEVPIEVYRKGIVESDENAYTSSNKIVQEKRNKRQIDLEDLLPFDEDTIEEYVYNFLSEKRNSSGITGLLAQAVTSDVSSVVDELEDDVDSEHDDEET